MNSYKVYWRRDDGLVMHGHVRATTVGDADHKVRSVDPRNIVGVMDDDLEEEFCDAVVANALTRLRERLQERRQETAKLQYGFMEHEAVFQDGKDTELESVIDMLTEMIDERKTPKTYGDST